MLFKKHKNQLREDDIGPSAAKDNDGQTYTEQPNEKEPPDNIVYPSGIKLALLMISIFIGMFLVALVCSTLRSFSGACQWAD